MAALGGTEPVGDGTLSEWEATMVAKDGISRRTTLACACCGTAVGLLSGQHLACAAAADHARTDLTPDQAFALI
jgi:hypothetical protein